MSPDGGSKEAVEFALCCLALHQNTGLESVAEDESVAPEVGRRMGSLIRSWTCLMPGIPAHLVLVTAEEGEEEARENQGEGSEPVGGGAQADLLGGAA